MRTVLVIDDEPDCRAIFGEVLQQQGWQVLQAANGEAGIELARRQRPDLVLCDLMMAPGNGFQVCRSLREMDARRQMRIVVVSGRDFPSDRQAALEAGADAYLTKPLDPRELFDLLDRFGIPHRPTEALGGGSQAGAFAPMWLKFWGVRGSVPTPGPTTLRYGGNTTCVEVRAGGQIIILDAGTGLRLLGQELAREFADQPLNLTMLLSHTHWDHIQGLPFFKPVYKPENRLRILGYEGARLSLDAVLSSQMENPFFPVGLQEVPANVSVEELKEMSFSVGPVQVRACFANHPGICVGYRLSAEGASVAFFPDNELRPAPGASPAAIEFARAENEKLAAFLHGTDVLIMDSQYDCEEYKSHVGWGHGCIESVVSLALAAEVKQLFLFHHDPDHDDAKVTRMVEHARQLVADRQGNLDVEAAREGLVVEVGAGRTKGR